MNALDNMLLYFNNSKQDDLYREVVGNILKKLKKVEKASIYELAEMCFVSTTTISRLCKKLGYKNFMDFKLELSNSVKKYAYLNRYIPINSIGKSEDEFDAYFRILKKQVEEFQAELDRDLLTKIAEAMHNCRKISIYTYGTSFAELSLQSDLVMTGKETVLFLDPSDQIHDAETLDSECFAFISIPSLSESAATEEAVKIAQERNARIFVLTTSRYSAFLKYADYSYCFDGMLHLIDMYRMTLFINFLSMTYRKNYID